MFLVDFHSKLVLMLMKKRVFALSRLCFVRSTWNELNCGVLSVRFPRPYISTVRLPFPKNVFKMAPKPIGEARAPTVFSPIKVGDMLLSHRMVMGPLTRWV